MENVKLRIEKNIQVGKDIFLMTLVGDTKAIKNPGELLRYATEDERRRWYKHVNKTDTLQPLANRIRETNYNNVDMVVDLIYCFVSGFTTEEFNKADLDIVADAIMDSFRYFFNYLSYYRKSDP